MMKKIFCIATIILCTSFSMISKPKAATIETPAADSRITYIGRTLTGENGEVSFDWSATSARIAFEGDFLALKASDTRKNYFNVWIDKEPCEEADFIIRTQGSDTTIVIAENLKKGAHKVTVQKRTEGEQGTTTFHSILSHGEILQAEPVRERLIEVVGDSYTCGYGSENSVAKTRFSAETENVNKAYEAVIARYFNADLITIAHSGMGICRNYNEEKKPHLVGYHMIERYTQTFDENKDIIWDAKSVDWKPSITIIYLGANDFSVSVQPHIERYRTKYFKLLQEIKDNYGEDHPILCCASRSNRFLFDYVREVATTCGLKNIRYAAIFPGVQVEDDTELGADSHPNYKAHKKIAHTFIPYVSTLTGWELEDKPIK